MGCFVRFILILLVLLSSFNSVLAGGSDIPRSNPASLALYERMKQQHGITNEYCAALNEHVDLFQSATLQAKGYNPSINLEQLPLNVWQADSKKLHDFFHVLAPYEKTLMQDEGVEKQLNRMRVLKVCVTGICSQLLPAPPVPQPPRLLQLLKKVKHFRKKDDGESDPGSPQWYYQLKEQHGMTPKYLAQLAARLCKFQQLKDAKEESGAFVSLLTNQRAPKNLVKNLAQDWAKLEAFFAAYAKHEEAFLACIYGAEIEASVREEIHNDIGDLAGVRNNVRALVVNVEHTPPSTPGRKKRRVISGKRKTPPKSPLPSLPTPAPRQAPPIAPKPASPPPPKLAPKPTPQKTTVALQGGMLLAPFSFMRQWLAGKAVPQAPRAAGTAVAQKDSALMRLLRSRFLQLNSPKTMAATLIALSAIAVFMLRTSTPVAAQRRAWWGV